MKVLETKKPYGLLLFLILYSANGISYFNRVVYPIATLFLLAVSFYWILKNRVHLKGLRKFFIGWVAYCFISFIYFETFHPLFFVLFPIVILSAYVLIKSDRELKTTFDIYEKIIFIFAKISLFFFAWQLVSISSLVSLFSLVDLNIGKSYNAIIYTIHNKAVSDQINQNSGFCWEPGPFACFLSLALIIHLLKNKFVLDKRVLIYVITLLTTFSSTGYFCLLIIFAWYIYRLNSKYFIFILPVVILFIMTVLNFSSNLNEKVLPQIINAQENFEFYSEYGREYQTSIGRFDGFLLNLEDFYNFPIIGYGGHFSATFSQVNKLNISSTSGLGNWLSQFGIIGILFLSVSLYKSSQLLVNSYQSKGGVVVLSIFLVIIFSFNLLFSPIFVFFFFIGLFKSKQSFI